MLFFHLQYLSMAIYTFFFLWIYKTEPPKTCIVYSKTHNYIT